MINLRITFADTLGLTCQYAWRFNYQINSLRRLHIEFQQSSELMNKLASLKSCHNKTASSAARYFREFRQIALLLCAIFLSIFVVIENTLNTISADAQRTTYWNRKPKLSFSILSLTRYSLGKRSTFAHSYC